VVVPLSGSNGPEMSSTDSETPSSGDTSDLPLSVDAGVVGSGVVEVATVEVATVEGAAVEADVSGVGAAVGLPVTTDSVTTVEAPTGPVSGESTSLPAESNPSWTAPDEAAAAASTGAAAALGVTSVVGGSGSVATATIEREAGHLPVPPSPPPAVEPSIASGSKPGQKGRIILLVGCVILATATVGLLQRNYGKTKSFSTIATLPAAAPSGPVAAPAPENTVVSPLVPVKFTPGPPAVPADLGVYQPELSASIRPYLAVTFGDPITDPKPWSTHLYGASDLPTNLQAPVDGNNQALCMVAQINLADLPAMPVANAVSGPITKWPKAGLLQFWLGLSPAGSPTGWTGGPSLQETVNQPGQRITYVAPADMVAAPAKSLPPAAQCTNNPPSRGGAVTLGLSFALKWNAPETTDARFDSAVPYLAGALRAPNTAEFYRALGSINGWLTNDTNAQIGGFNRLVSQDPRSIDALAGEGTRDGLATDLFEVLFEIHTAEDENGTWSIGFGSQGTGGWWADPSTVAGLTKTTTVPSAFWWDAQVVPADGGLTSEG
jgi:Domain of unknown function (DUF1963)